jgi:hypothetical protein
MRGVMRIHPLTTGPKMQPTDHEPRTKEKYLSPRGLPCRKRCLRIMVRMPPVEAFNAAIDIHDRAVVHGRAECGAESK